MDTIQETVAIFRCFICQNQFPKTTENSSSSQHLVGAEFALESLCELFKLPSAAWKGLVSSTEISQCELCTVCGERIQDVVKMQQEIYLIELKIRRIKDELRKSITCANGSSTISSDVPQAVAAVQQFLVQCLGKCEVRLNWLSETELRKHLRRKRGRPRGASNRRLPAGPRGKKSQKSIEPPDLGDENHCEDTEWGDDEGPASVVQVELESEQGEGEEGNPGLSAEDFQRRFFERKRGRPRLNPPGRKKPRDRSRKTYECRHCGDTFDMQRDLGKHLEEAHNDALFSECKYCGLKFLQQRRPASEVLATNDPTNNATTTEDNALPGSSTEHSIFSSPEMVFICGIDGCPRTFQTMSLLRIHHYTKCSASPSVQAQLGQKHPCPQCDRIFNKSADLNYHVATHHEKKFRFCCEICGKGFQFLGHLQKHGVYHSNELSFKCEECGKQFRRHDQLINHQKRHKGELSCVCEICGKGFLLKNHLNRHREGVHGEAKYACEICGAKFRSPEYVTQHVRVSHLGEKKQQRKKDKRQEDDVGGGFNAHAVVPVPVFPNQNTDWGQYISAVVEASTIEFR